MQTPILIIIIILIVLITVVSVIEIRKDHSKDKSSRTNRNVGTIPCTNASCKQICLEQCNKMYNNNPLCAPMCNYGMQDTIAQKCVIQCIAQGGYGLDVCLPFCDDDCHKYCVTIGCGGSNAVNSCGGLCY